MPPDRAGGPSIFAARRRDTTRLFPSAAPDPLATDDDRPLIAPSTGDPSNGPPITGVARAARKKARRVGPPWRGGPPCRIGRIGSSPHIGSCCFMVFSSGRHNRAWGRPPVAALSIPQTIRSGRNTGRLRPIHVAKTLRPDWVYLKRAGLSKWLSVVRAAFRGVLAPETRQQKSGAASVRLDRKS